MRDNILALSFAHSMRQIRNINFPIVVLLLLHFPSLLFSQEQPFKLSSPGDYIATGLLIPATLGAKSLYNHKPPLTVEQVQKLNINNINRFDRSAVYRNSASSARASDFLLKGSLVAPALLFIDSKMREDVGVKALIYVQTLALTGAEVSFVKGLIDRARPFVYNPDVPMSRKLTSDANCSFLSGHTAMTAAATYYIAAIASGVYGPKYDWTWIAASVPPLLTGYFRYNSGNHFFSDVLAGFIVGSVNGFLVTKLHEN
jgi:membrane-associated phospholipid phosphatase